MQMRDPAPAEHARDLIDLADQPFGIAIDRLPAPHRLGVAAAVKADLGAIRHVDIKREVRIGL